jgi:acyl-ACP thioesterase
MSEINTTKQTDEYRGNYFHFEEIATRWMDNDAYGHVNNVTYYSYFDTVTNSFLVIALLALLLTQVVIIKPQSLFLNQWTLVYELII